MSNPPPIKTRKPTGRASWPIVCLAGVEGSGKSWKAAAASASPLVHRTFWIGYGEDDPDEYGIIDGARFEIVEHDGTYRGILDAVTSARLQEPGPAGQPNLIVLDSGARMWQMLTEVAQATVNERATTKAAKQGRTARIPEDGLKITPDLWNTIRDRWGYIMTELRSHQGPSIVTTRLRLKTVFDDAGQPTKEKRWDQQGQADLGFESGAYVHMREGFPAVDDYLVKVKSARYKHPVDDKGNPVPQALPDDWTIQWLWERLGLADADVVGDRTHAEIRGVVGEDTETETREQLLADLQRACAAAQVAPGDVAAEWARTRNGQRITETSDFAGLRNVLDDLQGRAHLAAQAAAAAAAIREDEAVHEAPVDVPTSTSDEVNSEPAAAARSTVPLSAEEQAAASLYEEACAATTVEAVRAVWRASGQVRGVMIDDPQLGRVALGTFLMKHQSSLVATEQDARAAAAGN